METLEKIKRIEKHFGGQLQAAEFAGVAKNTWWRWSNGQATPNGVFIGLLYDNIFGCTAPRREADERTA